MAIVKTVEQTLERPATVEEDSPAVPKKGSGFLLWGLLVVFVLNLVMVIGALILFGP